MPQPPHTLPAALARQTRFSRLAGTIPALLAHPDWTTPVPTVIWMHGRSVSKELDNGRYLRFIRAGFAACAIDLPGHGERLDPSYQTPWHTLDTLSEALDEVDFIVEALAEPTFRGVFDLDRLALGGMSAGGMVTLRRLCDPHPFVCAAVEGTAGDLTSLYLTNPPPALTVRHPPGRVATLDPIQHLSLWRPIPLLALHSETDRIVPIRCVTSFIDALRDHYRARGADPDLITLRTWPSTGAPDEHNGFGRVAAEAKSAQIEFLSRAFGLS